MAQNTEQNKILPLTNDVVMQMYFTRKGNIPQLKQFIKAITHLTDDDLARVEIQNPKLRKERITEKDFIVDVNVTTKAGDLINIEMQMETHPGFIERMVSYNARNYSSQLERGDKYTKLKESISIVVVNFPMFDDTDDFYEHILFRRKNEKVFTNAMQFYILDLTKVSDKPNNVIEHWGALFKARSKEELEMLSRSSDELNDAVDKLIELSADEEVRYLANLRRDAEMMRKTREAEFRQREAEFERKVIEAEKKVIEAEKKVIGAEKKGLAAGHAEGHAEGHKEGRVEERIKAEVEKLEIAKKLLNMGISSADVASSTGFDVEVIENFIKQS